MKSHYLLVKVPPKYPQGQESPTWLEMLRGTYSECMAKFTELPDNVEAMVVQCVRWTSGTIKEA